MKKTEEGLPLLSVIVPVYNTEDYLARCLESILCQTTRNLEILVVDDGSTDRSPEIAEKYAAQDPRIRLLTHPENRGLYHARITGVKASTGAYIAFVDSDDWVSGDFFRELEERAVETGADMVVGKVVHEDEKGYRYFHNTYGSMTFEGLEGKKATEEYWRQEGRCFLWHTVWNKLYARSLWEKALPILEKQTRRLVMTEDFVFSSVLFNFVEKLADGKYGCYYYFQHSGASTSLKGGAAKLEKNLLDLGTAFRFVRRYLRSGEYRMEAEPSFLKWRELYAYFWFENIRRSEISREERKDLTTLLCRHLEQDDPEIKVPDASWFYRLTTAFDDRYIRLAKAIASPWVRCVSFDIFDTAVVRPFYRPTDLFLLMEEEFHRLVPDESRGFGFLRVMAERELRRKTVYGSKPVREEVTLEQIYQELEESAGLSSEVAAAMMELECRLEIRFCRARKSIRNLYQMALACGKKVYFTTDMYLPRQIIETILTGNGYGTYEGLLISGEVNRTKRTGSLFEVLLTESGVSPGEIFHIGDSWVSDVESPRKYKLHSAFYPAPVECLQYNISDIPTTHSCCPYTEPSGSMINLEKSMEYLGTRTALAVASLELYDMPFVSFHPGTEINGDPRFLGYYPLGMHLLAVARWLALDSTRQGYETLAFIARDGDLPMRAYEILRKQVPEAPVPRYLYTSRKAGMACGVFSGKELAGLSGHLNLSACTPRQFMAMLEPVLLPDTADYWEKQGIDLDEPFENYDRFQRTAAALAEYGWDEEGADHYRRSVAGYFASLLKGKSAVFDIGYSGRTQEMLTRLLGRPIDGYYIHENDESCACRQERDGFVIRSFYDYTPSITGVARELLFSRYAPSCVGYRMEGETAVPEFEPEEFRYPVWFLMTRIQQSALDFVEDFCQCFGPYLSRMHMRPMEVSYPYEYFLHTLTESDAHLFDCCRFEDDLWAGSTFCLSEQWKTDIDYHRIVPFYKAVDRERFQPVPETREERRQERHGEDLSHWFFMKQGIHRKSLLSKAAYWWAVDRSSFRNRARKHLSRNRKEGEGHE